MFDEILEKAGELLAAGEPFAIAVVVRREAPISGKPGDKAIIQNDGSICGWIGGGCTQPVVIKEARKALRDGQPRFVRVTPTTGANTPEGILEYPMTCHSGGTLDVYIEPVLPRPQLLILGKSAVARALAQLGKTLHYQVTVMAPGAVAEDFPGADAVWEDISPDPLRVTPHTFAVVATQGDHDEEALEMALKLDLPYLGFVASRKKAERVFQYLNDQGISGDRLQQIRAPAGLDIQAHLPEEIAVSILAEIIQVRRTTAPVAGEEVAGGTALAEQEAIDPVCGMTVNKASARYTVRYRDVTYYFCCPGCKGAFEKAPRTYAPATEDVGEVKEG
ncbi:MAG: YHS domain-containing protein [Calditrichaeota bacterium]|nr:MAG: YHS domain-containing protein [Calditrichota bacterium]